MKNILLITAFTLLAKLSFAQSVDFDLIKYKGLDFYSTKSEIIKKLGKPKKTYDPSYDCGFLSSDDSQIIHFVTLDYGNIKFTGNKKDKYVLDRVYFENDNSIVVQYGNRNLTHKTDFSELIELFGDEITQGFGERKDGDIIIFNKKNEDGIRIRIKNGKLAWLEYWSPC